MKTLRTLAAAIMLPAALALVIPTTQATAQKRGAAVEIAVTGDPGIDRIITMIKSAKKPMPAWLLDIALKATDLYVTYNNGKKVGEVKKDVAEVRREVAAILGIAADVVTQIEAGREMSDREVGLTHQLLAAHDRRLGDLTGRIVTLEQRADELTTQVQGWRQRTGELEQRFYRRGCGTGQARRGGQCVDVAANPR